MSQVYTSIIKPVIANNIYSFICLVFIYLFFTFYLLVYFLFIYLIFVYSIDFIQPFNQEEMF